MTVLQFDLDCSYEHSIINYDLRKRYNKVCLYTGIVAFVVTVHFMVALVLKSMDSNQINLTVALLRLLSELCWNTVIYSDYCVFFHRYHAMRPLSKWLAYCLQSYMLISTFVFFSILRHCPFYNCLI